MFSFERDQRALNVNAVALGALAILRYLMGSKGQEHYISNINYVSLLKKKKACKRLKFCLI